MNSAALNERRQAKTRAICLELALQTLLTAIQLIKLQSGKANADWCVTGLAAFFVSHCQTIASVRR